MPIREFSDADRKKKRGRIELPASPGNLSSEELAGLEEAVKATVRDGYVPCPAAWRVANDLGVSRLDVGVMIDKLSIRVTNCQLGCFKVDKTASEDSQELDLSKEAKPEVTKLPEEQNPTCANVFALSHKLGTKPLDLAELANSQGYKLKGCQLGCF